MKKVTFKMGLEGSVNLEKLQGREQGGVGMSEEVP